VAFRPVTFSVARRISELYLHASLGVHADCNFGDDDNDAMDDTHDCLVSMDAITAATDETFRDFMRSITWADVVVTELHFRLNSKLLSFLASK
jgi:hypothetical protein